MTDLAPAPTSDNSPAYSVSELAFALKRTLEDAYGHVRLRGELSKVTHHSNGHVYLTIKDDKAAIDGVVWKGSVRGLGVRPEQGLEVIVTGRITTYPAGSRYQIVIEAMEAAGVGALLAQLERLKARLAGEGLFDRERKRPLPAMPRVIGVVTSPTGAVIRDILHRIRDRWPCHVVVWPVVVQGDRAAAEVRAAVEGFNALPAEGGFMPRPDVVIVARGGGSVEDLWPFNDETLARAVAASTIPLISAVGHETDTTLIDFVADRRAPTPTAAAEMASPVLAELRAAIADHERRLARCSGRLLEERRTRLAAAARGLPKPVDILALAQQRFDMASGRLGAGLQRNVAVHAQQLARVASPLKPGLLDRPRVQKAQRLEETAARLTPCLERRLERLDDRFENLDGRLRAGLQKVVAADAQKLARIAAPLKPALLERRIERQGERLVALDKLRQSLNPDGPLRRGFARVERADGHLARSAAALAAGEGVTLVFADGRRGAVIDGAASAASPVAPPPPPPPPRAPKPKPPTPGQGDLF